MMGACGHFISYYPSMGEDYNLVWLILPALRMNFELGRLKNLKARSEARTKTNTRRTHFKETVPGLTEARIFLIHCRPHLITLVNG